MPSARTIPYQVLIAAALLLLLEGFARIAYTVHSNLAEPSPWYVFSADVGWDRRPHFDGYDDCDEHRAFDARGLVASDGARLGPKREGQFRAVFLGDSNTYGYCLETSDTFVEVANRLFPQATSINLGVNGYTSFQGYKSLLKYGKLIDPDIIFVSFNYNDRRFVLQPEQADSDAAFQQLYATSRRQHWAEVSYLFRAAHLVGGMFTPAGTAASGVVAEARVDKLRPRVDAQSYRQNLTKMVQWAKQNNVAVAFILLGDNPDQTKPLRDGMKYLSEKKYSQAIEHLTAAMDDQEGQTFSALARLHLAKAYSEVGRHAEAKGALSLKDASAWAHGGQPVVLDTEYNRIMKEVAAELSVPVVDAAAALSKIEDVYTDYCHFDARGHELVGRLVAEVIMAAHKNAPPTAEQPGGAGAAGGGERGF